MSNQYEKITGKLADVLDNYSDELLTLATNIYHNTDTDKDIEDIVIDLQKVLSNDMSIQQVEIELYQERCNTIYDY